MSGAWVLGQASCPRPVLPTNIVNSMRVLWCAFLGYFMVCVARFNAITVNAGDRRCTLGKEGCD